MGFSRQELLEWVTIFLSWWSFWLRDWTQVSCRWFLYLLSHLGIKPIPSPLGVHSLNHWTTRDIQPLQVFNHGSGPPSLLSICTCFLLHQTYFHSQSFAFVVLSARTTLPQTRVRSLPYRTQILLRDAFPDVATPPALLFSSYPACFHRNNIVHLLGA